MVARAFPLPSMNRLNQTDPATFSVLPFCVFFGDSVFIFIKLTKIIIMHMHYMNKKIEMV
jgi:hypothetical protein